MTFFPGLSLVIHLLIVTVKLISNGIDLLVSKILKK
jgi:hypothetical protein